LNTFELVGPSKSVFNSKKTRGARESEEEKEPKEGKAKSKSPDETLGSAKEAQNPIQRKEGGASELPGGEGEGVP